MNRKSVTVRRERRVERNHRSPEPALPLLLPRALPLPIACSEPDPERGDVREAYGGSGYAFMMLANLAGTGGGATGDWCGGGECDCVDGGCAYGFGGGTSRGGGAERGEYAGYCGAYP